jgi:hypothetical protein
MQELFEITEAGGAKFSECGKYRYGLWRKWDDTKPCIMFIGLNPSTATDTMDDPTIRRVKKFAKDWGYGGVYMCNLFAFISAYPVDLKTCADPIGENDKWLVLFSLLCKDVLFAWGNFKEATDRARKVSASFPNAVCLGFNKNGTPKHPLYVAAKTKQVNYK